MIDQTPFKIIDFRRNSINGGSINFDLGFKNYGELYDKAIELKEGGSEFDPLKF